MIAAKNSLVLLAFRQRSLSCLPGRLMPCAGYRPERGLPHAVSYTDSDEVYFGGARPIILNGIGDIINQQ